MEDGHRNISRDVDAKSPPAIVILLIGMAHRQVALVVSIIIVVASFIGRVRMEK
jgi:hypothetical protein